MADDQDYYLNADVKNLWINLKDAGENKANSYAMPLIMDVLDGNPHPYDVIIPGEIVNPVFAKETKKRLRARGQDVRSVGVESGDECSYFLYGPRVEVKGTWLYDSYMWDVFRRRPFMMHFTVDDYVDFVYVSHHAVFSQGRDLSRTLREVAVFPHIISEARDKFGCKRVAIFADLNCSNYVFRGKRNLFGLAKPIDFPKPGVKTSKGRGANTYDHNIIDSRYIDLKYGKVVELSRDTKDTIKSGLTIIDDEDGFKLYDQEEGFTFWKKGEGICVWDGKEVRKKEMYIGDHMGIETWFYLTHHSHFHPFDQIQVALERKIFRTSKRVKYQTL